MKNLVAIALILILILTTAAASADLYPETAKVVEVNYDEDTVTVETFMGFLFVFEGCEDWCEGDCVSMIMEDKGTMEVEDDEILMAQYSAWELVNWKE